MIESLYIGATGMHAQQLHVDAISNNLANVNTPGYKKNRVSFQDLMYRELGRLGVESAAPEAAQRFGSGVAAMQMGKLFQNGELKKTDSPMDIAINGKGFLEVTLRDGSSAYTRSGALQVTPEGLLATSDGNPLRPSIQIPSDAKDILIDASGRVMVSVPNESERIEAGQIELVDFINPAGLAPIGENLYITTENAGEPVAGTPGVDSFGQISQGYLEASNVKLVEEMVGLILAQRAYEVSAKVVQASDEMLGISNNLRR
ncbi:flagellar basal-body rod protein FlgG [Paucimonas lemoignei]|uniref:Flagellar basal-body rod protein FlgG n=1 Tax=Paucimonas lemoignei TaxID=29443 RepID=A0A4R3HXY3_PAULE|nr:flagellar basal-body rod protein FlgG [Paucimonas lemoignei]TCS37714.1 flagellar basal-body rod protein FlgG [Paucimonas lemoignei]